jgi:hypothetical protein
MSASDKYQDKSASRHPGTAIRRSRLRSRLTGPLFWLLTWPLFFAALKGFTELPSIWVVSIAAILATIVVFLTAYLNRRPKLGDVDVTGL